jgi:exodeoxyribonuclease V beta subunit
LGVYTILSQLTAYPFDLIAHPIENGFTLVEASAGTGKTYSITWLVIRLILERSLTAEQILVVTFTTAATEELRERIRSHITEVLATWHEAKARHSDDELARLYHGLSAEQQRQAPLQLQHVLEHFEDIQISTIHGFCSQALKDYGHEAGIESKPVNTHLQPLFDEIVDDYRSLVLSISSLPALRLMRVLKKELKVDRDQDLMPMCRMLEIGGWAHVLSDPLPLPPCDDIALQQRFVRLIQASQVLTHSEVSQEQLTSQINKDLNPSSTIIQTQNESSSNDHNPLPLPLGKTVLDEESSYQAWEQKQTHLNQTHLNQTHSTNDNQTIISDQTVNNESISVMPTDVVDAWRHIAQNFERDLQKDVLVILKQESLYVDLRNELYNMNQQAVWNKGGGEEAQLLGWIAIQRLQELGIFEVDCTTTTVVDPALIKALLSLTTDLKTLSTQELKAKLNKRKKKENQIFFDFTHPICDAIDQMIALMSHIAIGMNAWFRQGFVSYALQEIPMRKAQEGWMSTDDLIHQTYQALQVANSTLLQALRTRYKTALIDEFQDTDPSQWGIFSRIFNPNEGQTPVYLIGDPKQSIYRFRGADLNAYLAVKSATAPHRRFTMSRNFRSDPRILNVLNQFFDGRTPNLQDHYWDNVPAGSSSEGKGFFEDERVPYIHVDGGRDNRLSEVPAIKWVYFPQDLNLKPNEDLVEYVAADVAKFLKAEHQIGVEGKKRTVRVNDIGILVQTNKRARLVAAALARRGIPSTVVSDQSVYKTQAAAHCERLLRGILMPHNDEALRASLSASFFAMNAQDVSRYTEALRSIYVRIHELWVMQGLASAFRHLLYHPQLTLIQRILKQSDGAEILTHLTHLIERLQYAASHFTLSPELTLQWLRERRLEEGIEVADEDKVRPHIEEDAVEVVTIHRSKGLEYPILYCPDLWTSGSSVRKKNIMVLEPVQAGAPRSLDIRLLADSPPEPYRDQAHKQVHAAEARERRRLLYVALTRAVHHCCLYVSLGNKFQNNPLYFMLLGPDTTPYKKKKDGEAMILDRMHERIAMVDHDVAWEVRYATPSKKPWKTETELQTQMAVHIHPNSTDPHFATSSFTSLSRQILSQKKFTFSLAEQPELDESNQTYARAAIPYHGAPPALLTLPRSARFGECVHALLEYLDFAKCDPTQLEKHIRHSFRQWGFPFNLIDDMRNGLWELLHTPLGIMTQHLRLRDLAWSHRRQEISFEISLKSLKANDSVAHHDYLDANLLNQILALDPACEGIAPFPDHFILHGYLKGSIDLLFQHPQSNPPRYFIADYKSNWLGEGETSSLAHYHPNALQLVMTEHLYILQSHIYLVALYRLLQQKLGHTFNPKQHMGASLYLFIRGLAGMQSVIPAEHAFHINNPDGSITQQHIAGLYVHRPPVQVTALLSTALDQPHIARKQLKKLHQLGSR